MARRPSSTAKALELVQEHGRALPMSQALDCIDALKALGEETRVRIMELLIAAPLGVDAISRRLGVSPYNVSKHLRILREAGLLDVEKDGRRRLYALPDAIRGRAAGTGHVLDLGCCSFHFDQPRTRLSASPHAAPARRGGTRGVRT